MNRETIVIGDIHGTSSWKKIVENNKTQDIVFVGDYWDSFDIPFQEQLNNFRDIIAFKKANIDRVYLLIGNHDYHYIQIAENYSGFQGRNAGTIEKEIKNNIALFKMCHTVGGFMITHAGVSKTWCMNNNINPTEEEINALFKNNPSAFRFVGFNVYGDSIESSPIWIRPNSLIRDKVNGYRQIVGHTRSRFIIMKEIVLIDVLEDSPIPEYVRIDTDGVIHKEAVENS